MMNCRQATRLLSDAQERELSLGGRTALKMHVLMCSDCRNFSHQMGTLRDMTRAYAKGAKGVSPDAAESEDETNRD